MIQEPIDRIFPRKRRALCTFEQLKPIAMVKDEGKHDLEQIEAGKAKVFGDPCFLQMVRDS